MMNYKGRMISLQIVVASSAALFFYNYLVYGHIDVVLSAVSVFYVFFGWWLGKQYDKTKYDSEKDTLTDVNNRRFAMKIFPKLKRLSDKKSEKFTILLVDIDNFKSINDLHGHETGDRVLRQVSQVLIDCFRNTDYVIRWGGDEFIVMLPCIDERGTAALHGRLRNKIDRLSVHSSLNISVSMGSSTYPDEAFHLHDLIKIADQKMYSEKKDKIKTKRIRVFRHEPNQP